MEFSRDELIKLQAEYLAQRDRLFADANSADGAAQVIGRLIAKIDAQPKDTPKE